MHLNPSRPRIADHTQPPASDLVVTAVFTLRGTKPSAAPETLETFARYLGGLPDYSGTTVEIVRANVVQGR